MTDEGHTDGSASDLSVRCRAPELMDDPGLDRARHVHALNALATINRVSLTARRVWSEILRIHRASGRTVRVLDVACGAGDVLHAVARRAARTGVPVELCGCDTSPVALEEVERRSRDVPVGVLALDVVRDDLPDDNDLITSSLFLHHLAMDEAVALLRRMGQSTRLGLLVQDLRRTRLGYAFAWVGLHTLTSSEVARIDGLRSVRGAFSMDEARTLCAAAGLSSALVERAWPQRFVVRWRRRERLGRRRGWSRAGRVRRRA